MLVVLVKLGALVGRDAVEVGEQTGGVSLGLALLGRASFQVVDDRLGMDLLLDVKRRNVDDEVGPALAGPSTRQTSCASDRVSAPVSASSFFICSSVIVILAPFQISSGWLGSSAVRVSPSANGRALG